MTDTLLTTPAAFELEASLRQLLDRYVAEAGHDLRIGTAEGARYTLEQTARLARMAAAGEPDMEGNLRVARNNTALHLAGIAVANADGIDARLSGLLDAAIFIGTGILTRGISAGLGGT